MKRSVASNSILRGMKRWLLLASVLVAAVSTAPAQVVPLDYFDCYAMKRKTVIIRSTLAQVVLADQFQTGSYNVKLPDALCAPASLSNQALNNSVIHLQRYRIALAKGATSHLPSLVRVTNRFGTYFLRVLKPTHLLVPTAKALISSAWPDPPDPQSHNVNHFKCYGVKEDPADRQTITNLVTQDQFGLKAFVAVKPTALCAPTDKNQEGLKSVPDGLDHLLCYQVLPNRSGMVEVLLNNQFGPTHALTSAFEAFCVPSAKTEIIP